MTYLNLVNEKGGMAPRTFGLIHRKKKNEINLKSFYLRESYVEAFSEGINLSNEL